MSSFLDRILAAILPCIQADILTLHYCFCTSNDAFNPSCQAHTISKLFHL